MTLEYQDLAENIAQSDIHEGAVFDTVTETPILIAPATGGFTPEIVTLNFRLPEIAQPGTVTVTFVYESSVLPKDFPDRNPRVVTFDSNEVFLRQLLYRPA